MLNIDEILRISPTKLLVNLRGNKPLILDKMMYSEHPLASKLKDSPITEYNPSWTKNNFNKSVSRVQTKEIDEKNAKDTTVEKDNKKISELDWSNF